MTTSKHRKPATARHAARAKLGDTAEAKRLAEPSERRKWGPYLSDLSWGTVREDDLGDGNAWKHFTHDQAGSRTYRWGEDGIAGSSDQDQYLNFAVTLWNGKDPILTEGFFGLDYGEGNHGEHAKEYWFHDDAWFERHARIRPVLARIIEEDRKEGPDGMRMLSLVDRDRLGHLLKRMHDPVPVTD